MLQGEHSATLLTFIKLAVVVKLSFRSLYCLFLSGCFPQVLLFASSNFTNPKDRFFNDLAPQFLGQQALAGTKQALETQVDRLTSLLDRLENRVCIRPGDFCPSLGAELQPHSQSRIATFFPVLCWFFPNNEK